MSLPGDIPGFHSDDIELKIWGLRRRQNGDTLHEAVKQPKCDEPFGACWSVFVTICHTLVFKATRDHYD